MITSGRRSFWYYLKRRVPIEAGDEGDLVIAVRRDPGFPETEDLLVMYERVRQRHPELEFRRALVSLWNRWAAGTPVHKAQVALILREPDEEDRVLFCWVDRVAYFMRAGEDFDGCCLWLENHPEPIMVNHDFLEICRILGERR